MMHAPLFLNAAGDSDAVLHVTREGDDDHDVLWRQLEQRARPVRGAATPAGDCAL